MARFSLKKQRIIIQRLRHLCLQSVIESKPVRIRQLPVIIQDQADQLTGIDGTSLCQRSLRQQPARMRPLGRIVLH